MKIEEIVSKIEPISPFYMEEAEKRLDNLTKPKGSLGRLEEFAKRYIAATRNLEPKLGNKVIYVFASDHGVVCEGVSAYPKDVTWEMVKNFLSGGAAINVLARHVGAEVKVVDVGVDHDFVRIEGLINRKIARGTKNIAKGPAMTEDEAFLAIKCGIDLAEASYEEGVSIIGIGEMGIGNTTPSSAIFSVVTGLSPEDVTGKGTGIDEKRFKNKISVIKRAIEVNKPDPGDPIDILKKVGGFEIGAMLGVIIGASYRKIPVVVDGFISTSSAILAYLMKKEIKDYLFFSHLSAENGHRAALSFIGEKPMLDLGMRLGEGTGAALAMSILEASLKIFCEMRTFEEAGVSRGKL